MGLPIIFSQVLAASVTTGIVNAAATGSVGALTLVTTTLDAQRRLLVSATGNESSNVFTVVGTNAAGNKIVEAITGPNATTTQSNLDFKTVSSITASTATINVVSVGTDGAGSSLWQIVNWNVDPTNLGIAVETRTGTTTFQVDYTLDDPNNLIAGLVYPVPYTTAITNAAATGTLTNPCTAVRLTTLSGTGTLWFRMLQAGISSP